MEFRRFARIFVLSLLFLTVFGPVFRLSDGLEHINHEGFQKSWEDYAHSSWYLIPEEILEEDLSIPEDCEGSEELLAGDLLGTKEMSHVETVPHDPDILDSSRALDEKFKEMKEQVIWAKEYLKFSLGNSSSRLVKELEFRIMDIQQALSYSIESSHVSRSVLHKMKAMESTLLKARRIDPDCAAMVKTSRAMAHDFEEQVRKNLTQKALLEKLGGRLIPKGLRCLITRLTTEYYALKPEEREFPNKQNQQDPDLYHFVVFSDNILACSVVVNSTVSAASEPERVVFHVVTDSANFPSMSMWFLSNPPSKATVHVESADSFQLLSGKDIVTTKEASLLGKNSVDPRFASKLNHLLFYLPDIFPHLRKIVLLDHDVVVREDLTELWTTYMYDRVNGAVLTCDEMEPSFGRMGMFINFTDPVIEGRFRENSCTWAFGMNFFDLQQWRRQNLTQVYHKYLQLGNDRPLWKAGRLPIGWITFYGHTYGLSRRWNLLGLGYDSGVRQEDIVEAAVIHYDGNLKPWESFAIEKYRHFWSKHVKYEDHFLQSCGIHE